jgi:N-acetylneuraminic acid mutarotase
MMGYFLIVQQSFAQVNFNSSKLIGSSINSPTSLQFGPDGKLYVASQDGTIHRYTVQKNSANNYTVTQTEIINLVKQIKNHDDDGSLNTYINSRQITGILVTGTAAFPKLYVSSSDPRIGGAAGNSGPLGDGDSNLDTNSGIVSLLIWTGSAWDKTDLVRGLPRSEENHAVNGLALDAVSNQLYLAVGGHTNAGSPSVNFAKITEYALSACILKIDLNQLNGLTVNGTGNDKYVYDLPTLDDPSRTNSGFGDINDPFGGNDGRNQAKIVIGGPVQVFSSGYRNPYDLVITKTTGKGGRFYLVDNGANPGWGGFPDKEGTPQVTNNYVVGEPGSYSKGPNDAQVNNMDNLHLVYSPAMKAPIYGGHPNPIRANPASAGLFWNDAFGEHFELNPTSDWPPVPLSMADPIQSDFKNPGVNDGALTLFNSSTNGIAEYTATGFFNGEMTGDLVVASMDGSIYRIQLSADGTQVLSNKVLASGFGQIPLDIITQGDNDVYAGTLWAADYLSGAIHIFEPAGSTNNSGFWVAEATSDNILSQKRHDNGFVAAAGQLYLIGGRGDLPVEVYNPSTKKWSSVAPIPNNKELHNFQAVTVKDKIYIINAFTGGFPTEKPVPDIYVYDPSTNKWIIKTDGIPVARRRGGAVTVVYNDKIYFSGGITDGHNGGTVNWTDVYDPSNDSWSILANAPHLRDHAHAAVINGKIYVTGGRRTNALNNAIFSDLEPTTDVFDIATNSWVTLPTSANIPKPAANGACVAYDNKMFVIGGESTQQYAHKETYAFDPTNNTWTMRSNLIDARHGTQAAVFNSKIFIVSGSSQQGASASSELNTMETFASGIVMCSGNTTSTTMDDDGDGYSNKDETDNGTDPCSAASKPKDNDNDKISNLNDLDDDNDGILDVNDLFHIDAANGKNKFLPIDYPFLNGNPGSGLFGMGFTGLMKNGKNPDALYDASVDGFIMGGAVGLATVPADSGSMTKNSQRQAFQFGVMVDATTTPFTVESALVSPFFNNMPVAQLKDEQQGIYFGNGDQDNYVFVGITPNFGNPSIIVTTEIEGAISSKTYPISGLLNGTINLYLDINPAGGTIQPKYKRTGDTASIAVGSSIKVSGKLLQTLQGADAIALGLAASSKTGKTFSATWDYMNAYYNTAVTPTFSVRINAGGDSLTNNGIFWKADKYYVDVTPSNAYSTQNLVTNTTNTGIYKSERYGKSFGYAIPVINGIYEVRLHFAEIYYTAPGKRVFTVDVENGQGSIKDFDIYAATGKDVAIVKSFNVTVTDSMVNISLLATADNAKISGIEVVSLSNLVVVAPKVDSSLRINTGGGQYSLNGQTWKADQYFSTDDSTKPSHIYAVSDSIYNSPIQAIYQSERYGNAFTYNIPVANGDYLVNLHFAEIYWTFPGARVMNIDVENGQGKLSNFDIFATVGKNKPSVQSFPVHVKDSTVTIKLSTVLDQAKISGIEIIPTIIPAAIDTTPPQLSSFTLINAVLDTDLRTMKDGDTIDFLRLPVNLLNIRANTKPDSIGSVIFKLTGTQNSNRTESITPYSLFGDVVGNYVNWLPIAGNYTLTATPYKAAGGTGIAGIPLTIHFSVINDSSTLVSAAFPTINDSLNRLSLLRNQQQGFGAIVYPNPSSLGFTMQLIGNETASVKVYTATGILIASYNNIPPHQVLHIGSNWNRGFYFAVIKQGKTTTVEKMIRQ